MIHLRFGYNTVLSLLVALPLVTQALPTGTSRSDGTTNGATDTSLPPIHIAIDLFESFAPESGPFSQSRTLQNFPRSLPVHTYYSKTKHDVDLRVIPYIPLLFRYLTDNKIPFSVFGSFDQRYVKGRLGSLARLPQYSSYAPWGDVFVSGQGPEHIIGLDTPLPKLVGAPRDSFIPDTYFFGFQQPTGETYAPIPATFNADAFQNVLRRKNPRTELLVVSSVPSAVSFWDSRNRTIFPGVKISENRVTRKPIQAVVAAFATTNSVAFTIGALDFIFSEWKKRPPADRLRLARRIFHATDLMRSYEVYLRGEKIMREYSHEAALLPVNVAFVAPDLADPSHPQHRLFKILTRLSLSPSEQQAAEQSSGLAGLHCMTDTFGHAQIARRD